MENEIFTSIEALRVILRTTIIFIYAFFLLRMLGRRRLSHLTYLDVLLIIAFGSAVGDVMIYGENVVHIYSSILAITVVAILVKLIDEFTFRSKGAQAMFEGRATLLVNKGEPIRKAMAKENISMDSLMSMLRERDVHKFDNLRKVFLEPDGELSIIYFNNSTSRKTSASKTKKNPKNKKSTR